MSWINSITEKQETFILLRTHLDTCSGIDIPEVMHTMHARIGSLPLLGRNNIGLEELHFSSYLRKLHSICNQVSIEFRARCDVSESRKAFPFRNSPYVRFDKRRKACLNRFSESASIHSWFVSSTSHLYLTSVLFHTSD